MLPLSLFVLPLPSFMPPAIVCAPGCHLCSPGSSAAASPAAAVTASHTCVLSPPMLLLQLQLQLWNCIFHCHRHRRAYMCPPSGSPFCSCVLALHSPPFRL
ncbi:hypothetical protein PILCRDRAFT_14362 [Piloderma croceum F 1598]|uniref:Secreted protein n=1 Tax=Piloderma croceum (strain F 1598) TaxID=765440 RepID=A0A0C3BAU6_PILCF|nr:hypothetical protein PILCRDRAFT_14362 [Piloderma croceum F 1598]